MSSHMPFGAYSFLLKFVSPMKLQHALTVSRDFGVGLDDLSLEYLKLILLKAWIIPTMYMEFNAFFLMDKLEQLLDPVVDFEEYRSEIEVVPSFVLTCIYDDEPPVPDEAYSSCERDVLSEVSYPPELCESGEGISPSEEMSEPILNPSWASVSSGSVDVEDLPWLADETNSDDVTFDKFTNMPEEYAPLWNDGAVQANWSTVYELGEPPKPRFKPKTTDKVCHPTIIQDAINDIFPFHHEIDDRYFQTWVETEDISLEVSKCWIDASNFRDFDKGRSSYAEPIFQSGATSRRVNTQRETLLAVKKRNMNIPELQACFDMNSEVNTCFERFLTHVVDLNRLRRLTPMLGTEVEFFKRYIEGKNPPLKEYEGPLPLQSLDKYMHMVKTTLKPVEDNSLRYERPICATITYHKKGIVMQSSPVFLSAMSRIFYVLKSKIHIPSGKWHQLFTLDADAFDAAKWFKEVDFSKFDKSQGELHHKVQEKIFHALKLPPDFVDMWFTSHEQSHITDRETGFGFSVDYQRRTGDANTYLGNTLVTLICLARVYDLCDPNVTFVVASGDDSLIGSLEELPRAPEHLFTSLFNFEAKFPHNQPFICSKFLISVDLEDGSREVIAVPNPAKLLIKMGRKDCQLDSLDEIYTSWLDVVHYFRDSRVCEKVAKLCAYRQTRRDSMYLLSALLSLPSCFANKRKFLWLCYSLTEQDCIDRLDAKKKIFKQKHIPNNDESKSPRFDGVPVHIGDAVQPNVCQVVVPRQQPKSRNRRRSGSGRTTSSGQHSRFTTEVRGEGFHQPRNYDERGLSKSHGYGARKLV
ncbi:MAG: RNA-dependent RNA polymerase [Tomato ilarvirus 1]|uniref:RNA-directed RNA polymerase 2a n=1 Tax=Tomato ilarvirus 1 TaxID=2950890 RepID=A0AAX3BPZ2_9BROM|nr:MAG: RNA-dependent RNA polymerase [Tomato ilarvirus 1]